MNSPIEKVFNIQTKPLVIIGDFIKNHRAFKHGYLFNCKTFCPTLEHLRLRNHEFEVVEKETSHMEAIASSTTSIVSFRRKTHILSQMTHSLVF